MRQELGVAILGASGYTGSEMIRLCLAHPNIEIRALSAERHAGQSIGTVFPHLAHQVLPSLTKIEDIDFGQVDAVFCCLPHATTQKVIAGLDPDLTVLDLSADFRLRDVSSYAQWYGSPHLAPELQQEAVYGLAEINRQDISSARLIAVPGCYPTSALLPLVPLLRKKAIGPERITIDAKSGATGAGRSERQANLYSEISDGFHAYGVGKHRHMPEIEQGLSLAAGQDISISFTPHLVPMNRGILSTIYVELSDNMISASGLRKVLNDFYADAHFVHVMEEGVFPATRHVRGTNQCRIAVADDHIKGRAIIISVIDNLIKGAAGQAMQDFNIRFGFSEDIGIPSVALFP